ncbi:MAG: hypothetical protein H7175_22450, partial [Burkholderiales bacterium]|nr:hypothetical protein [Anaerolineae bacterium]
PAGTYDESVYFLPGAFRYFIANEEYALEIVTALIGFVSIHKDRLEQDGILEIVRDCIRECFERWTGEFVVVHDLMAEGAPVAYFDYVKNTAFVASTIAELARFETHVDIAEKFLRDLTENDGDPVKAAWFLEFAASRFQYAEPIEHESIVALINDKDRLNKAAEIVRRHQDFIDAAPTYWRDTFKVLNID